MTGAGEESEPSGYHSPREPHSWERKGSQHVFPEEVEEENSTRAKNSLRKASLPSIDFNIYSVQGQ